MSELASLDLILTSRKLEHRIESNLFGRRVHLEQRRHSEPQMHPVRRVVLGRDLDDDVAEARLMLLNRLLDLLHQLQAMSRGAHGEPAEIG